MKTLAKILIGLTILFQVTAFAQTDREDLLSRLSQVKAMKADFTQWSSDGSGTFQQEGKGSMAFQRPGKFKWVTTNPINQLFIADGKKIYTYDKDLEQITIQNQTSDFTNSPAMLLSSTPENITKDFNITSRQDKDGKGTWFTLRPKKQSEWFDLVQFRFMKDELQEMLLNDTLGKTNKFLFTNIKINPSISAQEFSFTPPKGVDVIDQATKSTTKS